MKLIPIYSTVIAGISQLAETKQSPEQTVINFVVTPGDCFSAYRLIAMTFIIIKIHQVKSDLKPHLGGLGVKPAEGMEQGVWSKIINPLTTKNTKDTQSNTKELATKQSPEQTVINFVVTPGDCFSAYRRIAMTFILIGFRKAVVQKFVRSGIIFFVFKIHNNLN